MKAASTPGRTRPSRPAGRWCRAPLLGAATLFLAAAPAMADDAMFEDFDADLDPDVWNISDGWSNGYWMNCSWSADRVRVENGTLFLSIGPAPEDPDGYTCGEVQTRRRLGYGTYEARMRSNAGGGIVSAFFTYIGRVHGRSHEEIDFEVAGKRPRSVETNYFRRGEEMGSVRTPTSYDVTEEFVTYAFEWLPRRIRWYVDGELIREVEGDTVPIAPAKAYFSHWIGSPDLEGWLGLFEGAEAPQEIEIDWFAFTPVGEGCTFPASVVCKHGEESG